MALSRLYERSDQLAKAIDAGERARALGPSGGSRFAYRLARLHALTEHPEKALDWLEVALRERFENRPGIVEDAAFQTLAENERFRRLAGVLPTGMTEPSDLWRFDLAYLVEEAERMHADPARPALDAPFRDAVAALYSEIPRLTDDEIYLGMMKLLALLDDGHTAIYQPGEGSPAKINTLGLPLQFYRFQEGLFITDGVDSWSELAGHRVLRFGDLEATEVLRRMAPYRGGDNPTTWLWMGPQFYLGRLALLRAVGASTDGETVELTLESPSGERIKKTVAGGSYGLFRKLRPSPAGPKEQPLWQSNIDANYWLHPFPERKALYFQFNQVRDDDNESIAEFADRLRSALRSQRVRALVVDVRHNNGGNNSLVRPLVQALIEFELQSEENEIYLLTGRNTFSAAQNFINQIEKWTDAKFVGEPSASSPNFVGEETHLRLPYSQIIGSISSQYWQDSDPNDRRPSIPIDLPVDLSAADYFSGRDPVLEAVLRRFVRQRTSGK